jgi:acyl-CoA synthetase (AMP-forming)/AMP-acid ligase II
LIDGPLADNNTVNDLVFLDPSSDVIVDDSLSPLPSFANLDASCSENVTALLLFSSGTTGSQKAVMLTHRNLQASVAMHTYV